MRKGHDLKGDSVNLQEALERIAELEATVNGLLHDNECLRKDLKDAEELDAANEVIMDDKNKDLDAMQVERDRFRRLLAEVVEDSWENTIGETRVIPGHLFERIKQAGSESGARPS